MLETTANAERRASTDARVEQILARMTLEEKAALMFQTPWLIGEDGAAEPLYEFGHGLAY